MAPIPPSCRRGYQLRAEELNNILDLVAADVHLENYCREAQMAESLWRKFQEIARRAGPSGDQLPWLRHQGKVN